MPDSFLIAGATGFLGSHFVHSLLKNGNKVIALKRSCSNLWRLEDVINDKKLVIYNIDDMENSFIDNDVCCVINTVCTYGRNKETLVDIVRSNIVFALQLFELSKKYNVEVFFNTDTLLQKDLNNYSLSKKQLVEWLRKNPKGIQLFNMRIELMYGLNDDSTKFVNWVLQQLKDNVSEIQLTSGIQKRDFVFVEDVVSAYLKVYENRRRLGNFVEFDVATGNQIRVKDFILEIYTQLKNKMPELKTVLNFGSKEYRVDEAMNVSEDVSPLYNLGWKPSNDYKYNISLMLEE